MSVKCAHNPTVVHGHGWSELNKVKGSDENLQQNCNGCSHLILSTKGTAAHIPRQSRAISLDLKVSVPSCSPCKYKHKALALNF